MNNRYLEEEDDDFIPPEFHRNEDLDETGVSQVMIEGFVKYRMRYLLQMHAEVENGQSLGDGEIELLGRIIKRAHNFNHLIHEYPEYKELVAKVISLVDEITDKALVNEQRGRP